MPKIETILFPTDFSRPAEHALAWAADMARTFGARLTILHVVPPSAYPLHNVAQLRGFPNLRDEVNKRCLDELQTLVGRVPDTPTDTLVLEGIPHAEIVDHATKGSFGLIVMATHGHTGLKHMLLGSVAERVVRLAPCPVLTVRAPGQA